MTIHEPWRDVILEPLVRDHFVQVYRDQRVLLEAISLFAAGALGRNEAVIVVATQERGRELERRLGEDGFDVATLKAWGQLAILDAEELLSRFMVDGAPDEERFKSLIASLVTAARASGRFKDVRVYGEMVNLLWVENTAAAARLEELWNDVIEEHALTLFCAYCLAGQGEADRCFPSDLQSLHTHFIPIDACS